MDSFACEMGVVAETEKSVEWKRRGLPVALWGTALIKVEGDSESVASPGKPRVVPHHRNCSCPPPTTHRSLSAGQDQPLGCQCGGGEKNALFPTGASLHHLQALSCSECLSPSPAACLIEPFLNRCCGPSLLATVAHHFLSCPIGYAQMRKHTNSYFPSYTPLLLLLCLSHYHLGSAPCQ